MADGVFKIAVVGAATLRGKEVADALAESVFAAADVTLLDDDAAIGQLETVGDEVAVVQALSDESFERKDFVFFAGSRAQTLEHWKAARDAGGFVVDLSQAIEAESALTMFPWQRASASLGLDAQLLRVAHPVAQALALIAERAAAAGTVDFLSATALEPASEQDKAGMDELHQQTVKLLSFQPLPMEVNGAQVAFNVLTASSADARASLRAIEEMIVRQYAVSAESAAPLMLQLAQAPVFHAYVVAVHLRMHAPLRLQDLRASLAGPHIVSSDDEWPSNLAVAGQNDLLLHVRCGNDDAAAGRDFRLWFALDNLRVAALSGVAAAEAVRHLRPRGDVQ